MPDAILDMLAPAEALKTRLESISELVGIDIIVDRQKDVLSEITKAVAKAKGAAIVILLDGWGEPPEGEATYLRLRHSISLYTKPVLRGGYLSEAIALGAMLRAIQGWRPDESECERWHVGAGLTDQDPEFRIVVFPAFFEVTLYPV